MSIPCQVRRWAGRPLIRMDARDSKSCLVTLIGVVEHAPARSTAA
ncbi:MAG TPA: hypothetical protein VGP36_14875 [Mycobacteriales bacterium]|nr:hypothetical protein [Mycobacteriales bacterium]